jgi:hypothetical protein
MVSNDVFSFLKGNVGEEDIIKLLLISAVKALVSVAIFIGGLMAYVKLCEIIGFEVTTLLFGIFTILMFFHFSRGISFDLMQLENKFSIWNYRTWKYILDGIQIRKLFYLSLTDVKIDIGMFDLDYASERIGSLYLSSWIKSLLATVFIYSFGVILIYTYAIIISSDIFISAPIESYIIIGAIVTSFSLLSYLFLKLKWKKIWKDGKVNWNLVAWCICASVIITTISFIAGVAIRNLAGIIGVEYTVILVLLYTIITAVYVYVDIKEWIAKKEYEAARLIRVRERQEQEDAKKAQLGNNP